MKKFFSIICLITLIIILNVIIQCSKKEETPLKLKEPEFNPYGGDKIDFSQLNSENQKLFATEYDTKAVNNIDEIQKYALISPDSKYIVKIVRTLFGVGEGEESFTLFIYDTKGRELFKKIFSGGGFDGDDNTKSLIFINNGQYLMLKVFASMITDDPAKLLLINIKTKEIIEEKNIEPNDVFLSPDKNMIRYTQKKGNKSLTKIRNFEKGYLKVFDDSEYSIGGIILKNNYFYAGTADMKNMILFDDNCNIVWKKNVEGQNSWNFFEVSPDLKYVVYEIMPTTVICLDNSNGKELWRKDKVKYKSDNINFFRFIRFDKDFISFEGTILNQEKEAKYNTIINIDYSGNIISVNMTLKNRGDKNEN